MGAYLESYVKRERREVRMMGHVMALAFSEPNKINEVFADPAEPEAVEPGSANDVALETSKWWD